MSGGSKFSLFRPRVERSPLKRTNGDMLGLVPLATGDAGDERKANNKLAAFFAMVALLFVLADQFGRVRDRTDANLGKDSTALVSLSLLPPERSENGTEFFMRFRLSNRGNRSVFYPMSTNTSVTVGQLVARASPTSDWMSLSSTSKQPVPAIEQFMDSNLTWIEMPPGGWVDGEFQDVGDSPEEHAYVIYVKPARDASGVRIISKSFASPAM